MKRASIEALRASDFGVVATLHAKCFYDAWDKEMIEQVLDMPGSFGLVARRSGYGSIVGFALARIAVDECELLSLGVSPDRRAQGIGADLLAASIECAMVAKARWFFLEVARDNDSALRLYSGYGLIKIGQRPDYYENKDGSRTDAFTLRCDLADIGTPGGGAGRCDST